MSILATLLRPIILKKHTWPTFSCTRTPAWKQTVRTILPVRDPFPNTRSKLTAKMKNQSLITSPNDKRKYRSIHLENGLRALLISDPKTEDCHAEDDSEKLSAAGLCIGVGSFSDPPDIPGLAHFLEHMVFMGSEKYPDENGFDNFIKLQGGNNNAYTDCERTVFYFDIGRQHFYEGLDRFAQFFIKPLMAQGSQDREIKAVDSEFDMSLTSDRSRKEQLLAMMATEAHPMGKFMWGNTQTLKSVPAQNGIDVYQRLQEFRQYAYSAHYMTLALQSRDDLDTLEKWVKEIFSAVPNNGLAQPTFAHQSDPFNNNSFFKLYKAIPVNNVHQVELTWSLPCLLQEYRKKPLHYLGFLIGHEGQGSLLAYLKKKLWALSLAAGNSETGFEHNSTWAIFSICATLTPLGMENLPQVLTVIFQYLDMLRREGPQKRIFDEIQTIEANDFRWQEQGEPCDYVESLCENMQVYPEEHYITGDCLLYEYDPQLIEQIQNSLVPRKASVLIYSKQFSEGGQCDQKEPWYQTKYHVSDVPSEWLSSWENPEVLPDLHLPAENTYIATDFNIKEPDTAHNEYPVLLSDVSQGKLWYKKDAKFKVPKAYIHFILKSPVIGATPLSFATFDMFLHVLRQNLSEIAYAADAAQLSYLLSGNSQGMTIKLSGFNHKLPKLFETIVDHIANFEVDDKLFLTVKDQLQRVYHNKAFSPRELVSEVRLSLLQHPSWSVVTRHQCLKHITRDMLITFAQQFKAQLLVEGYIHGNFTAKEAIALQDELVAKLGCEPLPAYAVPEVRVIELPVGETYIRVENFNVQDNNSAIVQYFMHGPGALREALINELLIMRMEEPCFDQLRTRLQLGYDVHCMNHNTDGIIGLSVTVCSQANKFSMPELVSHIDQFLEDFKVLVDQTTEEEFQALVQSMIMLKKCEDSHMGEEADRNWLEILTDCFLFDRLPKAVALLETFTLEEFKHWLNRQVPTDKQHRKLSVQVVGNASAKGAALRDAGEGEEEEEEDEERSDEEEDGDHSEDEGEDSEAEPDDGEEEMEVEGGSEDFERTTQLHFLPVEDNIKQETITDMASFCNSRPLYPVSRIV